MNKIFLAAAMLSLHVTVAHAASPEIEEHHSPGGTRFVLVSVPEAEKLVIQLAWPTDWAVNPAVNPTAPVLATRSQFVSGSEEHDPGVLGVLLDDAGAEAHLTLDSQFAYGSIVVPRKGAEDVLAAINDHLRTPRFDESWFNRARNAGIDGMAKVRNSPSALTFGAIGWATFGDHPFAMSTSLGNSDSAREVARLDLASWAQETYSSNPFAFILAGDIDAEAAGLLVDKLLRGLPEMQLSPALPIGSQSSGRVLIHVPRAKDSYVAISGTVPVSPMWPKFDDGFIVRTLASSDGGLINDAVRKSLRAAYSIMAAVYEFHYTSHYFAIHGFVETSKVDAAVEEILRSYGNYVESPSVEGLDRYRDRSLETLHRTRSDPITLSLAALKAVLRGHDVSALQERRARAERLSPEMIRERVRKGYPKAGDLLVVVASPDADALPGACVIEAPKEVLECELK